MENNQKKACNHIVSYSEGVDEAWLNYSDKPSTKHYVEIEFNYCPLCGEEIRLKNAEPDNQI